MSLIITLVASVLGLAIGLWVMRQKALAHRQQQAAHADPGARLKTAKSDADRLRQNAHNEAKVVREETRQGFAESLDRMEVDLKDMAARLERKDQSVKVRDTAVSERRKNIQTKEADVRERQGKIVPVPRFRADLSQQIRQKLVERCGANEGELIAQIVEDRLNDANLHATQVKLGAEEAAKSEAERRAKRIIGISNERFNMSHQPDHENPGYRLSDPDIVERVTNDVTFRDAFIAATEAELNLSDDGKFIDVRGVDPLKREIGRRTLVYMKTQGVVHVDRIPTVLQRVQKEVDKELEKAAERAVRILRIAPLEGEVKRLFSRLLYRASYSQNQWHHAVEVAYVCGMMASELGLDVRTARRAGLLHDIGKAMTHDHEGSHALLGADVARRQGESEEVANAIAAHHGEEPLISPYAEITAAGDAISGARPGARREIQEAFNSKVDDLERIAYDIPGVQRVHVMQGGREVRVFVGEREVKTDTRMQVGWDAIYGNKHPSNNHIKDEQMGEIARQITSTIEEQLTYPGQIRVTIIRETRAVGIAR